MSAQWKAMHQEPLLSPSFAPPGKQRAGFARSVGRVSEPADGTLKTWAQRLIERFAHTYSEVSPSGQGIKIWCRAKLPGPGRKPTFIDGGVEVYDSGRSRRLDEISMGERSAGVPEVDRVSPRQMP